MGVRSGKGDKGFTDLPFQGCISKDSADINAIGDLDELNCYLGLIKSKVRARKDKAILEAIQRAVFRIITEISVGAEKKGKLGLLLRKEDSDWIKTFVCQLEQKTKLESCFYLPGDNELSAFLDIARTVARRAERTVVGLFREEKVKNEYILSYLNCISDVLFIMAREKAPVKKKRQPVKKRKVIVRRRKVR